MLLISTRVDDYPYGGGAGMVMKPDPFFNCGFFMAGKEKRKIIMLSPGPFIQSRCRHELAYEDRDIIFFCGRYEAIDQRKRLSRRGRISMGTTY
jgi:tRNA (guanine37-N1)-methyltransferase